MKGMPKNFINYFSVVVVLSLSIALSAQELSVVRLTNEQLELGWKKGVGGYTLETLKVKGTNGWEIMEIAKYQHNVLYASSKLVLCILIAELGKVTKMEIKASARY